MIASDLRVCLVSPVPPPYGGISNWTALVMDGVRRLDGVNLRIVNTAPRWRAVDDLVPWKRIIGGTAQFTRDFAAFCWSLLSRPHVVHLTTSGQLAAFRDVVILAVAKLMNVPTVYHIRFGRIPEIAEKRTNEWRVMELALRLANVVIAIDAHTAETVQARFPASRIVRIPNGAAIDTLPAATCGRTELRALFLGWVIPTKGVAELVEAWRTLDLPEWHCLIAGPGSEDIRRELLDLYDPKRLEFLPEQQHSDAMQLIADSDVFVLPSHTEGFPNVVVEAMALGKAVVASSVGAIPEMLAGECGVLVPPRNASALSKALRTVCGDSEFRSRIGARAREKAHKEYDIGRVVEQLVSLWRELAGANNRAN